jgi:membrane-associated protease RseP (regulator of RpoE activity)
LSTNPLEPPTIPAAPEPFEPAVRPLGRPRFRNRLSVHVTLFVLTLVTATLAGAQHYAAFASNFDTREVPVDWWLLLNGLWYSGTFLAILGAHEFGHYYYCRRYNLDASLPYFLPLPPFLFITGTLGAVIRIREPFRSKQELFDVGIAGPLAGLVVLVPLLVFGLSQSYSVPAPTEGYVYHLGEPLLFQWAAALMFGPVPDGHWMNMHPVVFGCWFGMLATALNLMPFGQLDGGHITYAIFGDRLSRWVSAATAVGLAAMVSLSLAWIVPAVMLVVMWGVIGLRHPPVLNPYDHIDGRRRLVAALALLAFIVCFTPTPMRIEELVRIP